MKIEELRVGNLVKDQKGQIREVKGIDSYSEDHLWLKIPNCSLAIGRHSIKDINPINITEELLLNCAFEYSCYGGLFLKSIWEKTDITLRISIRKDIIQSFLCENEIDLKYIHELQNIYYYITKEELEIKL